MAEVGSLRVSLGLDSAEFKRSIQDVNRRLKLAQSEFQAAGGSVKGFENTLEGLQAKSDYLSKTFELQQQKVETLRKQYEAIKQAKGETSKEAENLAIRLNQAIAAMKKTEAQLEETNAAIEEQTSKWSKLKNSLNEVSEKFQTIGDRMKEAGQTLTQSLTIPLVGLGIGALKAASDVEGAQARIQGQLGLTSEEAEKLTGIAKEVWEKGFGENLEEVTSSLGILKQNMKGVADTDLQPLIQSAYTIRDLFGADIQETTATAGVLMKQFGVDGQTAMDLITVGFQRGGDFSGELLDTLREYAPQFAAMGFNAEQALSMLITGAEAGAFNLDKVGDAMKEFNIRMKDGSDTTAEALQALGFNVQDITSKFAQGGEEGQKAMQAVMLALSSIEDPLQRNQLGVALFGTQWEDLESDVITAMATAKTELGNVEGVTKKAGDALQQSFGERVQQAIRGLQTALEPIGNVLLGMVEKALPALQSFSEWFSGLSPTIQQNIVVVGGLMAALGPLLVIFGSIASAISTLMPVFAAVGAAIAGITAPVWGVIAAIAALVAAGVALWMNWDTVKAKAIEIWGAIKEWFSVTLENIKQFFSDTWTNIKEFTATTWENIKQTATDVWNAIKDAVIGIITPFVDGITSIFNGMKDGLQKIFEGLKQYFSGVWELIKNIFLGAVLLIVDLVTGDFEGLKNDAKAIFDNLKNALQSIWEGIKLVFSGALEAIKGFTNVAWENIKSNTSIVFNAVKSTISSIWEGIKSFFSTTVENIKTTIRNGFENMKNAVFEKMTTAKQTIVDIWNSAKQFLSSIDLYEIGRNIIQGLISGISSMASVLWEKAKAIADMVKNTIRDALDINSPSRVMRDQIGKWIPLGLAEGIERNINAVVSATNRMAQATIPSVPGMTVAGGGTVQTTNISRYGNVSINVTIPVNDLEQIRTVNDFFNRLGMKVRQA